MSAIRTTSLAFLFVTVLILLFASPAVAKPPNVVLIISDDQAWTDFGFMGHEVIKTPHLDKLADRSALFPSGYVPTALCRPSLASMITGLYPHQHRICTNDPPEGMDRSKMLTHIRSVPTLPRLLKKAGYRSFQTGKWWEGHYSNGGFTDGMTTKGRHGGPGLVIARKTMQPIYDFIDACGEAPFFLWHAPFLPHNPHNPPQRFLEKYAVDGRNIKLAKYYAMCEWFDETCGQLLDYIDRKGLRENTLVIFVVDNGWIQETGPKRTTRGWFAPKSKLSPYDGGVRTPVLLRWPGHTKPGRYRDLVSSVDLAPTILRACGLRPPNEMPGLNLLDVAAGNGRLKRDAVFGELFIHAAKDIYKPAANLTHRWVRRNDWKLILPHNKTTSPELYNLADDPLENKNLADTHPQKVRQLTAMLNKWWNPKPDAP